MAYTFDGTNKRITLSAGTVTLDLVDMHSRWKDWVLSGNAQYAPAFKTVGGDIPAIPLYLFLLNGWRIVPQSANHTLAVGNGILDVDGASGADPFVYPAGYDVRTRMTAPGIAIGYSSNGGTGPSAAEIAAEVLVALQGTTVPADVRKVLGQDVVGMGTESDPWGPAL